jgi:hypothetical protein
MEKSTKIIIGVSAGVLLLGTIVAISMLGKKKTTPVVAPTTGGTSSTEKNPYTAATDTALEGRARQLCKAKGLSGKKLRECTRATKAAQKAAGLKKGVNWANVLATGVEIAGVVASTKDETGKGVFGGLFDGKDESFTGQEKYNDFE